MMTFQGVVCYGFNPDKSIEDLLNLNKISVHHETNCYELELENKYYQTKIHLFDYDTLTDDKRDSTLKECHAIILHGNGIDEMMLEEKVKFLDEVGGEPRLLVCDDHDDSLRAWSLKNGFDLLDISDEDVKSQMIDSLSAYKWPYRIDKDEQQKQLDEETIRKLMDFDYLLNRVKTCRDDPDDKKIHEIGQLLSGLLGDDIDKFLADDDDDACDDDDDDGNDDNVESTNSKHQDATEATSKQ